MSNEGLVDRLQYANGLSQHFSPFSCIVAVKHAGKPVAAPFRCYIPSVSLLRGSPNNHGSRLSGRNSFVQSRPLDRRDPYCHGSSIGLRTRSWNIHQRGETGTIVRAV